MLYPDHIAQRFWNKVGKRTAEECWTFGTGKRNNPPVFYLWQNHTGRVAAHRLSWELINNSYVPEDAWIERTCRNISCVNPSHLKLVHKDKSRQPSKYTRAARIYLDARENSTCLKCDISHPAVLDFHHRDPASKKFSLSNAMNCKNKVLITPEEMIEELAKCDILCSNCHRIHHWEQRNNAT